MFYDLEIELRLLLFIVLNNWCRKYNVMKREIHLNKIIENYLCELLYSEIIYDTYNNNWITISMHKYLPDIFIEKYSHKVKWYHICIYQKLSEEFMERNSNHINWLNVSQYQKLSEKFILFVFLHITINIPTISWLILYSIPWCICGYSAFIG